MTHELKTTSALRAGDVLAAAAASGCVLAACWGRYRFELATDARPTAELAPVVVAACGAALGAFVVVLTHARSCTSRQRVLSGATVGLVLGGLAALTGVSVADALTAACGAVLVNLAFRTGESKRGAAIAAALALPLILAWAWTVSPWRAFAGAVDRPSYATLWRQAQDVIGVLLPACLLAGLALLQRCDLAPGAAVAGWWWAVPFGAAFLVPAFVVSSPLSISAGALLVLPAGWSALRSMGAAGGCAGLRATGVVLLLAMALWLRPAAVAVTQVVWVGLFPP